MTDKGSDGQDLFGDNSGLDQLMGSSSNSASSDGSFFGAMDREDRRRQRRGALQDGAAASVSAPKPLKPKWVETCHIHKGEWVDVTVRLPDPCPECKKVDGHGQKARVFERPAGRMAEATDGKPFDEEFTRQQRSRSKRLRHPFRN